MKKRFVILITLLAVCGAVYLASTLPSADASPAVTAREVLLGGKSVGEVLVDNQVVFRIRTSAGGYTPYQRSLIVAERLERLMGDSFQPEDVSIGVVNGQRVVTADGDVIITADANHARLNRTAPMTLAGTWAGRLRYAAAGKPVSDAPIVRPEVSLTPTAQKVVPIISVGQGVRVGGALVTGSRARLDEVKAVAQVETQYQDVARIRILVPVSTEDVVQQIRRVPQTAVIGLVDIEL